MSAIEKLSEAAHARLEAEFQAAIDAGELDPPAEPVVEQEQEAA